MCLSGEFGEWVGAGVNRSSKWCGMWCALCPQDNSGYVLTAVAAAAVCCLLLLQLCSRHAGHEHSSAAAQDLLMLLSTAQRSTAWGLQQHGRCVEVGAAQRSMAGCFRGRARSFSHTKELCGATALAEHGKAWRVLGVRSTWQVAPPPWGRGLCTWVHCSPLRLGMHVCGGGRGACAAMARGVLGTSGCVCPALAVVYYCS